MYVNKSECSTCPAVVFCVPAHQQQGMAISYSILSASPAFLVVAEERGRRSAPFSMLSLPACGFTPETQLTPGAEWAAGGFLPCCLPDGQWGRRCLLRAQPGWEAVIRLVGAR